MFRSLDQINDRLGIANGLLREIAANVAISAISPADLPNDEPSEVVYSGDPIGKADIERMLASAGTGETTVAYEEKPKIVVMLGSTRFIDIMAVLAWLIERDENAIVMNLHLLPDWYPSSSPDHLAEHEGAKDKLDALHMRKIDLADEIFVVDYNGHIGESTAVAMNHAKEQGVNARFLSKEIAYGMTIESMIEHKNVTGMKNSARPAPL